MKGRQTSRKKDEMQADRVSGFLQLGEQTQFGSFYIQKSASDASVKICLLHRSEQN